MDISNSAKLIAIGEEGIEILKSIETKLINDISVETIELNQDVDKEFVRCLLDGVDVLFVTYNTENKRSNDIVKAISFMASERRVLSVGINSSQKNHNEELNINREILINDSNKNELSEFMNIVIDSISDKTMISIDLTDLKEVFAGDKGMKYSYSKLSTDTNVDDMIAKISENTTTIGDDFVGKNAVVLIEINDNEISESETLILTNELLTKLIEVSDKSYEIIFSLNLIKNDNKEINIATIYN